MTDREAGDVRGAAPDLLLTPRERELLELAEGADAYSWWPTDPEWWHRGLSMPLAEFAAGASPDTIKSLLRSLGQTRAQAKTALDNLDHIWAFSVHDYPEQRACFEAALASLRSLLSDLAVGEEKRK